MKNKFNYEGSYKCVCGREFNNSQAYNGHKGWCKEHHLQEYGNLDKYFKNKEIFHKNLSAGTTVQKEIAEINAKENLSKWISEKHTCEKCGKVMTKLYGSGRFCSSSCARSFSTSKNRNEINAKVSYSFKKNNSHASPVIYKNNYVITNKKQKVIIKLLNILNYMINPNYCVICNNVLPYTHRHRKTCSDSCHHKLLKDVSKGKIRWHIHRNKISYPEKFFMKVLTNNEIKYVQDKPVSQENGYYYYLDFYIEKNGSLLDLEIDGSQHKLEERIVHDKKRDEFLRSKNYIVYRIEWNNINAVEGQLIMKNKINQFLEFYSKL